MESCKRVLQVKAVEDSLLRVLIQLFTFMVSGSPKL